MYIRVWPCFFIVVTLHAGAKFVCALNCENEGCQLNLAPVCGENGITYANECIATCQSVSIVPCKDDNKDARFSNGSKYTKDGSVTMAVMKQFQNDGFTFVGQSDPEMFSLAPLHAERIVNEDDLLNQAESIVKTPMAVRVTPEGYEYMAVLDSVGQSSGVLSSVDGFDPLKNEQSPEVPPHDDSGKLQRRLKLIGTDSRSRVFPTIYYPTTTIGFVTPIGCTGTVISRTSVLTAGHCVYDHSTSDWRSGIDFVPGSYNNGVGSVSPYGRWAWRYVTTYTSFIEQEIGWYDVAVINYFAQDSCHVGDVVGYYGFREVNDDLNDADLQKDETSITGYPGDKLIGDMWTSGPCPGDYEPIPSTFWGEHQCDTFPGNSGSGVLDVPNVRALGVHVASLEDPGYNVAVMFTKSSGHFNTVLDWSERNDVIPACSLAPTMAPTTSRSTCPCLRIQFLCRIRNGCFLAFPGDE